MTVQDELIQIAEMIDAARMRLARLGSRLKDPKEGDRLRIQMAEVSTGLCDLSDKEHP